MSLLGIFLCLTLSALADAQENEESILERDLQDFVRQFTQQQQMRSPFLFPPSSKRPTTEEGVGDVDRETHELESSAVSSAATSGVVGEGGPSAARHQQQVVKETVVRKEDDSWSDVYFVAIVAGCCAVGIFGVISAGFCFYKLQKGRKAAADVDYPAYGVTGPAALSSPNGGGGGDRKLAQSAQMYHYQHQKQQMIAVEKAGSTKNTSASDVDSEEEIGEEGDYTVYECPGLAPTGEMEVKNPLFQDDSTPPVKSSSLQNN